MPSRGPILRQINVDLLGLYTMHIRSMNRAEERVLGLISSF